MIIDGILIHVYETFKVSGVPPRVATIKDDWVSGFGETDTEAIRALSARLRKMADELDNSRL